MLTRFLAPLKLLLVGTVIFFYFLITFPLSLFLKKFPYQTKKILNRLVGVASKLILFILDVKVEIESSPQDIKFKNYFIVSNHLSYLDILILSSKVPTSYVTSLDIKKTPFLGKITELAGCLYVDRKNRRNIHAEIIDIEMALSFDLNVTVFPEATSTNGEQVLPFKRSLYQAAINSGRDVLPLSINYQLIGGEGINRLNRDTVCWYGDMDFLPHLWNLCLSNHITAELVFSAPINPLGEDVDTAKLRDLSYEKICSNFVSVL